MRLSNVLAASAVMVVASSAFAATVDLNVGDRVRFIDRPGTNGGEFGVAVLPAANTEKFVTFCVQRNEFLDFNPAGFDVVGIGTQSILGNQPLAAQTAYLYTQFRNGTLAGYDTSTAANHLASADALQAAIWSFQNQTAPVVNAFTTLANNAIANNLWTGIGNVRIANIVWATARSGFAAGSPAQDVLVIIPLPPAVFAGLGLLGVVAVGQIRRRLGSTVTV